jgi:[ribosomal protein S18]-alanine N-acetyltransferase
MTKEDIQQVSAIDREAFPTMWPPVNFQHELTNRLAHYVIAGDGIQAPAEPVPALAAPPGPPRTFLGIRLPFSRSKSPIKTPPGPVESISGFLGMWLMVDEAHIINIAVREAYRGKGIGELLLISGIDMATNLKASMVTLEVRVSNTIAQNLYAKYGFNNVGVRKKYYTDNNEDALIMTTDNISFTPFKEKFRHLKEAHFQKLPDVEYQLPTTNPQ